jgi:hypothetical protein
MATANLLPWGHPSPRPSTGINWIDQQTVTVPGLESVTFDQDTFVATGIDGRIWSSPDAQLWTPAETGVDGLERGHVRQRKFYCGRRFLHQLARGVATQSGGQPQLCLQALGFESGLSPGFHLSATVEGGRTYHLQSAPELPADSWTEVSRVSIPARDLAGDAAFRRLCARQRSIRNSIA